MDGDIAVVEMELVCMCKFEKQCHAVSVHRSMSLGEIYDELSRKCAEINGMSVILKYLAPEQRMYVCLYDDKDVWNMCYVHCCAKKGVIDMEASRKTPISTRISSHVQNDARSVIGDSSSHPSVANTPRIATISLESMRDGIIGEGQTFDNADEFRTAILNYAIANYRNYKFVKNESDKIIVVCSNLDCNWRVYARRGKRDGMFAIRRCNLTHNCEIGLGDRGHPRAKSIWVSNIVKARMRHTPSTKPKDIVNEVHEHYGVTLKYRHAWRGKEVALTDIHGRCAGSFDQLRSYCSALKSSNPGSIADYEIEEGSGKFQRLFIAFRASLVGFVHGCRPLIFLDGTFLKQKFRGCLLAATGLDANNGLFPVAFAVVNAENNINWEWFCWKLSNALSQFNGGCWGRYTFFSDRHSGLLHAVPYCFPGCYHSYCLRHLVDNYKKEVLTKYPLLNKKHWTDVFKQAAYGMTLDVFNTSIDQIITAMPRARKFITDSNPEKWANALFSGSRWGFLNNNPAESYNSWIRGARHLPITAMVDEIRVQIMEQMCTRRNEVFEGTTTLCPKAQVLLNAAYKRSRSVKLHLSSPTRFEVVDSQHTHDVNLEARTCTCKEWQVTGIPCKHACACIESKGDSMFQYCDQYYTVHMYKLAYNEVINPVAFGGHEEPTPTDVLIRAPDVLTQPGRPKTKRLKSHVEVPSRHLKCTRCKRGGHNRRTCRNPISAT